MVEDLEGFAVPHSLQSMWWDGAKSYPITKGPSMKSLSPLTSGIRFESIRKPINSLRLLPHISPRMDSAQEENIAKHSKLTRKGRRAFSRLSGMMEMEEEETDIYKSEKTNQQQQQHYSNGTHRLRLRRALMDERRSQNDASWSSTKEEYFPPPNKMAEIHEERLALYQKIAQLEKAISEKQNNIDTSKSVDSEEYKSCLESRVEQLEKLVQQQQTIQNFNSVETKARDRIITASEITSNILGTQLLELFQRCKMNNFESDSRVTLLMLEDRQRCLIQQRKLFDKVKAVEEAQAIGHQMVDLEKREELIRVHLLADVVPKLMLPLLRKQEEILRFIFARQALTNFTNLTQQFFFLACGSIGKAQHAWEQRRYKAACILQRLVLRFNARLILGIHGIVADTLEQEENFRWKLASDEEVERELLETQHRQEKRGITLLLRHKHKQFEIRKQKFIDGAWELDPDEDDQVVVRTPRFTRPQSAQKSTDIPTYLPYFDHNCVKDKHARYDNSKKQYQDSSQLSFKNLEEKILVLHVEEYESRWEIENEEKEAFADSFTQVTEVKFGSWEVESVSESWEMQPIFGNKKGGLITTEMQESANRSVIDQNWFKEYMILWATCYNVEEIQYLRRSSVSSTESEFKYSGATMAW